MKRDEMMAKIEKIGERAAAPAGLEIVEIELKGSGHNQLLRIVIDRPEGVTHADCELVSRQVGDLLDTEDPIPGSYQLEVSSPGVERPLRTWRDWERFLGKKAKVILKEPLTAEDGGEALKHFDGVIARAENQSLTVELGGGRQVTFPFEQVSRANLRFEW